LTTQFTPTSLDSLLVRKPAMVLQFGRLLTSQEQADSTKALTKAHQALGHESVGVVAHLNMSSQATPSGQSSYKGGLNGLYGQQLEALRGYVLPSKFVPVTAYLEPVGTGFPVGLLSGKEARAILKGPTYDDCPYINNFFGLDATRVVPFDKALFNGRYGMPIRVFDAIAKRTGSHDPASGEASPKQAVAALNESFRLLYDNRAKWLTPQQNRAFEAFKHQDSPWLEPYAKETAKQLVAKLPDVQRTEAKQAELEDRFKFVQFIALDNTKHQIADLKKQGIQIAADFAFNPGPLDVAAQPKAYLKGGVTGCPPDPFSPTGQVWGGKLMDPKARVTLMKQRLDQLDQVGITTVRVDHALGNFDPFLIPEGSNNGLGLGETLEHEGQSLKGRAFRLYTHVHQSPSSDEVPRHLKRATLARASDQQLDANGQSKPVGSADYLTENAAKRLAPQLGQPMLEIAQYADSKGIRLVNEFLGVVTQPAAAALAWVNQSLEANGKKAMPNMGIPIWHHPGDANDSQLETCDPRRKDKHDVLFPQGTHDNKNLHKELAGIHHEDGGQRVAIISKQYVDDLLPGLPDVTRQALADHVQDTAHSQEKPGDYFTLIAAVSSKHGTPAYYPLNNVLKGDDAYNRPGQPGHLQWRKSLEAPQAHIASYVKAVEANEAVNHPLAEALALASTLQAGSPPKPDQLKTLGTLLNTARILEAPEPGEAHHQTAQPPTLLAKLDAVLGVRPDGNWATLFDTGGQKTS
jgi:4-alpha-glucanotransferase